MHFPTYLAAAVLATAPTTPNGLARAPWNNVTAAWVTQTVTAYKTYCPAPTHFTEGNATYTATQKSWVTITDCPDKCTISFFPGPQQTIAPVKPCTACEPATTPSSTGSSSSTNSTGSTGSFNTGAGFSSGPSSSNFTGSGSIGSTNSSSGGSGSTGSGSTSSGSNGSGFTGNQNNTPAQTVSSGAKLSASLSGLAVAAILFIAL